MSTFFPATRIAARALISNSTLYPYYNAWFQLDGALSIIAHALRALYDLACLALRVLVTPLVILNPLAWIDLPGHLMHIVDDFVGCALSLVAVVTHPIVFVLRTLVSLVIGYGQGNQTYTYDETEENHELAMATTIWEDEPITCSL